MGAKGRPHSLRKSLRTVQGRVALLEKRDAAVLKACGSPVATFNSFDEGETVIPPVGAVNKNQVRVSYLRQEIWMSSLRGFRV